MGGDDEAMWYEISAGFRGSLCEAAEEGRRKKAEREKDMKVVVAACVGLFCVTELCCVYVIKAWLCACVACLQRVYGCDWLTCCVIIIAKQSSPYLSPVRHPSYVLGFVRV